MAFPDLPTVAESGVPGYDFTLWLGLAAPAATPAEIIQQLNKTLNGVLQQKDLQARMQTQSIDTLSSTPREFAEKIKRDRVIYTRLVKDAGAAAE